MKSYGICLFLTSFSMIISRSIHVAAGGTSFFLMCEEHSCVLIHSSCRRTFKLFPCLDCIMKDRETWHAAVHGHAKSWTWLSDWTAVFKIYPRCCVCAWSTASIVYMWPLYQSVRVDYTANTPQITGISCLITLCFAFVFYRYCIFL